MKKILGLYIGVSSVGMAIIIQEGGKAALKKLAVRAVPEDPNFHGNFYSGNTASKNLDRRTKRGARRNNQRFKLRRDRLYQLLEELDMFPTSELFQLSTLELYGLRAKAAESKIGLAELGRVLIHLHQKRGFKSNRKANTTEDSDSQFKQQIQERESALGDKTIGQQLYEELTEMRMPNESQLRNRTYLRASYLAEFNRIWACQQRFYPDLLTGKVDATDIRGTLLKTIRDGIIFYQRPLKSQKGLVGKCRYEKNHRAVSTSSPYFEMFRILQQVNDLTWKDAQGQIHLPDLEQKQRLFDCLFWAKEVSASNKMGWSKIKKILGYPNVTKMYFNVEEFKGNRTVFEIKKALKSVGITDMDQFLTFDYKEDDPNHGLFKLWHIVYSIDQDDQVVRALQKYFDLSEQEAADLAQQLHFKPEYGSLSTKAVRKLLPHLLEGKSYFGACEAVGYDPTGYKTVIPLQEKLDPVYPNELRNPVAEQVLNQMVNMVNQAIDQFGHFDEIRVELARDLKNSAKTRKDIFSKNNRSKRENEEIRRKLKEEYGFTAVNGRDVQRYKLWESTEHICLYCNKTITKTAFLDGQADTDHILPKSRSFTNSMDNFVLSHNVCNRAKGQQTAFDFMQSKGNAALELYLKTIQDLFEKKNISRTKLAYLTSSGADIPGDFVQRMLKDTQYIVTEAVRRLKTVCEKTYTTTGQITDFLRKEWGLNRVLEELNLPKYKLVGLTEQRVKKGRGEMHAYEAIADWTKRNDHRHHAIDALITALTDPKIVFRLNNLNKLYQMEQGKLTPEARKELEDAIGGRFDLKEFADQTAVSIPCPIDNLRHSLREALLDIFISYKKSNSKVLSPNTNIIQQAKGQKLPQQTWVPRGSLHKDTIMGLRMVPESIPLAKLETLDSIKNPELKEVVMEYTAAFGHNLKKAFAKKNLSKQPLLWKGKPVETIWVNSPMASKRVKLSALTEAQLKKIADQAISQKVVEWAEAHGGLEKAKAILAETPLYFNEAAGIRIERVTVLENKSLVPLRYKRDHFGKSIQSTTIPADFVDLGNNHHALVYQDEQGNTRSRLISFWEAVETGLHNLRENNKPYPIINRQVDPLLGTFKFSMQINDLFTIDLFHSENPVEDYEINFGDPANRARISERLFRVQKMSTTDSGQLYVNFRHHLETSVKNESPALRGITWERFSSDKNLLRLTKIKINHLGDILKIGEL